MSNATVIIAIISILPATIAAIATLIVAVSTRGKAINIHDMVNGQRAELETQLAAARVTIDTLRQTIVRERLQRQGRLS